MQKFQQLLLINYLNLQSKKMTLPLKNLLSKKKLFRVRFNIHMELLTKVFNDV